jgi:diguanylate cyclase (GGDEF)-like protein
METGIRSRHAENDGAEKGLALRAEVSRVVSMDRRRVNLKRLLDETVSSALLSQEQELARTLEKVYEISTSLQSGVPDARALSKALRNVLVCAARQFALDRELRSLALTDDLTGLYNRRAFLALSAQQLKVARRKGEILLLLFADLDHLKQINDAFGHSEGDKALVRTARALQRTFRTSDIIARLGGDEFAVLALEASRQDMQAIRTRLDRELKVANAGASHCKISVSVGAARFDNKNGVSLAELMAQADEAMYQNKKKSIRTSVHRDPLNEGSLPAVLSLRTS